MSISFNHPGVISGMSERVDGSMIWWNTLPVNEAVRQNRDRYFEKIGVDPARVVAGGIIHGTRVVKVGDEHAGQYLLNSDGLITNVADVVLSVTAADCMPVFFFDPVTKSVGMAHAGWRGLIAGVLENVIREMGRAYGSRPEDIRVIIGPHIRACHYKVGEDVAAQFAEENVDRRDGQLFVRLASEAEMRLRGLGVSEISVHPACTYKDERYYSARRDKSDPLEGMVAYIGLKV
ncbi:MAG: peptidoglycan editing factor PgeF [Candidatus Uhrbacteria bacterium]|nr:peptidoglycan editing factor PgeF [Candidatus Uhrbacteria bacterium]